MTTFKEISGQLIKSLSSDPSPATSGDMWYNSTSQTLKGVINTGAWSSGGNLSTARSQGAGFGIQTAALYAGGDTPPVTNVTEEYNGSGWTSSGNYVSSIKQFAGAGTQTAGLAFGGNPGYITTSAEYNGSSWTAGNALPAGKGYHGASGIQTAGLGYSGYRGGAGALTTSEEYDGTNWTSGGTLGTARYVVHSTQGLQTASFVAGGLVSPGTIRTQVEEYNGSAWSEVNDLPAGSYAQAGAGTLTSGLIAGGKSTTTNVISTSLEYDGTNWSATPSLATAKQSMGGAGASNSSAVVFGGLTPSTTGATEEYNVSTSTITAAAWSSNPALSYSVDANLASSGSLTSAVAAGGYNAPAGPGTVSYIAKAATWNGTAWSNITDMPVRRTSNNAVGATAPAFYTFGGQNQPGPSTSTHLPSTFNWNGSSWGAGPNLAEGQSGGAAAGTPNAIVLMGGTNPPGSISNNIQQYNGSSWSNSPVNMPTNMSGQGGVGTQTAAISFGGYQGASPFPSAGVTNTYEWDGSSISSGGSMVFGLLGCSGSGTSTAALSYGGRNTAGNKNAIGMLYNGTSWATSPSLGTARDYIAMGPMGSATSCLAVAGSGGAQSLVEEFTGETTAVNSANNITTS